MRPIVTTETTDTLVGPGGSDIQSLPVVAPLEDGSSLSFWLLDDDDRRRLAEGGLIGLAVLAHPQPPVKMAVLSPPCPRCGKSMKWSPDLETYTCSEEDEEPEPAL